MLSESGSNPRKRLGKIPLNELRIEPEHAKAEARELSIAARIRCNAPRVISTIHFNDEARGRREEIHDETANRRLAPKCNAEPTHTNFSPERGFRSSHREAHFASALGDEGCGFGTN